MREYSPRGTREGEMEGSRRPACHGPIHEPKHGHDSGSPPPGKGTNRVSNVEPGADGESAEVKWRFAAGQSTMRGLLFIPGAFLFPRHLLRIWRTSSVLSGAFP